ncbi:hypothetical protein HOD29_05325 [archaeon]|jgi:uncharacterized HAD superfamily protein|nr:hypothetical protein [archaeon]
MNKRLKIGIDLDDVVFDFIQTILDFYLQEYNRVILFENVHTFQLDEIFNISLEETMNLIKKMALEGLVENMSLCKDAKESIYELSKDHDIYFITSRLVRDYTPESLDNNFGDIKFGLYYSSNPYVGTKGKTKGEICNELGIDLMIEDSREHAEICARKGVKTFLLNKPWNKAYDLGENIKRVYNWKQVLEGIENGLH